MLRIKKRFNQGMTLIESMIALAILAVIITAITTLIAQVNALTSSTRLRSGATAQAQSTLEQARGYYQTNGWNSLATAAVGATQGTPNCFKDGQSFSTANSTGCTSPATITGTDYSRVVKVFPVGQSQVTVQAVISWTESGGSKFIQSDAYFYNY